VAVPEGEVGPRPQREFAGVFEGGGAKGIAYVGALEAVEERGWFSAVAGASAGAITACLVASGMRSNALRTATRKALETVTPGSVRASLRRLRDPKAASIIDTAKLRAWLETQLHRQLGLPVDDGRPVTFKALFTETGIELFVVAVDAYLRRHVVFASRLTPAVSVADAVVASSSIPIVFRPSRVVRTATAGDAEIACATIDGGVWTNFPLFVFTDRQFRKAEGLDPDFDVPILGFVLDEQRPVPAKDEIVRLGADAKRGEVLSETLNRLGPGALDKAADYAGRRLPFWRRIWGRLRDTSRDPVGIEALATPDIATSVPLARARGWRNIQGMIEQGLSGLHNPLVARLVAGMTVAGQVLAVVALASWVGDLTSWREVVAWVLSVTVFTAAFAAAMVGLALILANGVLLRPLEAMGFAVVSTYLGASGAPYWLLGNTPTDPGLTVIRLPILQDVTTLAFKPRRPELIDEQIEAARAATEEALDKAAD
jgi:predicted acylesterase/phospholipase RssA